MSKNMVINVRVGGTLSEFVTSNVSKTGSYENVSEYVRDLIRRDKFNKEQVAFESLKAELQKAFPLLTVSMLNFQPMILSLVIPNFFEFYATLFDFKSGRFPSG